MNQQYLCTRPPMKPHEATAKKLMGSPYKERFKEQNLDPFKIFQLFKVPVNEDAQGPLRKELAACTRTDEGHSHSMPQLLESAVLFYAARGFPFHFCATTRTKRRISSQTMASCTGAAAGFD